MMLKLSEEDAKEFYGWSINHSYTKGLQKVRESSEEKEIAVGEDSIPSPDYDSWAERGGGNS